MMKKRYAKKGTELIGKLKDHIVVCLQNHPEGLAGIEVAELQQFAGLTIRGRNNQEVWCLAFYALLIELVKERRIFSKTRIRRTNDLNDSTKVWVQKS